jgi:hypothetical protein
VLRTKDGNKGNAVGVGQNVNGAAALGVNTGLIGDEADMFAVERRKILLFPYIYAWLSN